MPTRIIETKLARGLANAGIFVHELPENELENTHPAVTKILEKRTQKVRELTSTKAILDWIGRSDEALRVFPSIFAMREHADYCSIYMEYLEGAGDQPRDNLEAVIDAITTSVVSMNRGMTAPDVQKHAKKILGAWEKKSHAARSSLGLSESREGSVKQACLLLMKQPVFMGHNDLFWPNMAIDSRAGTVRFLDFGLVGNNIAGAEFHHFFRRTLLEKKGNDLFDRLIDKYSRKSGIPAGFLVMASQAYALVRSYERIGRIREKKNKRRLEKEISFIENAEQKLFETIAMV